MSIAIEAAELPVLACASMPGVERFQWLTTEETQAAVETALNGPL